MPSASKTDGETILLGGHLLEMVSYSDTIRKAFSMERRHTWQPRPSDCSESPPSSSPCQERHFWVKVKCHEITNLSPSQKQYSYIASCPVLGRCSSWSICCLWWWTTTWWIKPDSLPEFYTPTYGVDYCGFYSMSGSFPPNLDTNTKNKFAET